MGGRLRGGDWNAAFFDLDQGHRLATLKTGFRITDTRFYNSGGTLLVAGATGAGKPKRKISLSALEKLNSMKLLLRILDSFAYYSTDSHGDDDPC